MIAIVISCIISFFVLVCVFIYAWFCERDIRRMNASIGRKYESFFTKYLGA